MGLSPGKLCRANDSLTTATRGAASVSDSAMPRPDRSGIRMAGKNPGVANRRLATRGSPGSAGVPAGSTGQMPPPMVMGRKLM